MTTTQASFSSAAIHVIGQYNDAGKTLVGLRTATAMLAASTCRQRSACVKATATPRPPTKPSAC